MIDAILDSARSLTSLMDEESRELSRRGRCTDHEQTVAAKRRLMAQLDAEIARLNRETPDWMRELDQEAKAALSEAMAALREVARDNAIIVNRHLSLSSEMIDAVAAEAKRLTGNRGCSYRRTGAISQRDASSPISVNTRL